MNAKIAAMSLFLMAGSAFADDDRGHILIEGQGTAAAEPELVALTVQVTSICYDTSVAAKNANAVLANGLLALLDSYATQQGDEVTASPGANVRRTETIYVDGEPKTLCEFKWRATNTLTIKLKNMESLPELQDAILAQVDAAANVDPDQTAQTYAELSHPSFQLTKETLIRLRSEAQGKAYDDAKAQFDTFTSRCPFGDPRLTTIEPPSYQAYSRIDGRAVADEPTQTPMRPDDIAVTATWKFKWTFEPVSGCPL